MKVLAVSGKQGSGKTTLINELAKVLSSNKIIKFAGFLYEMLDIIKFEIKANITQDGTLKVPNNVLTRSIVNKLVKYLGQHIPEVKDWEEHILSQIIEDYINSVAILTMEIGHTSDIDAILLQKLGTEYGRNCIDPVIWVKFWNSKVSKSAVDYVLNDDLRFENEFNGIIGNAIRIRLNCNEEVRKQRASKWRENTNHASEIGLDNYSDIGKFDLYYDTEKMSTTDIVKDLLTKIK